LPAGVGTAGQRRRSRPVIVAVVTVHRYSPPEGGEIRK
jgi:hypothetical protein